MQNESHKHHYIPQFIIRNWAIDGKVKISNAEGTKVKYSTPESVFQENDFYRDESNVDSPVQIETDMARLECEAAKVVRKCVEMKKTICLSENEESLLIHFLYVLGIRSPEGKNTFYSNSSKIKERYFSGWECDDIDEFWKTNLHELANCRSVEEVLRNVNINIGIKLNYQLQIENYYLVFAECMRGTEIVLSSSYPVSVNCISKLYGEELFYTISPLSPNRVVFVVSKDVLDTLDMRVDWNINPIIFRKCKKRVIRKNNGNETVVEYPVAKICGIEAKGINAALIHHAYSGYVFRGSNKIK